MSYGEPVEATEPHAAETAVVLHLMPPEGTEVVEQVVSEVAKQRQVDRLALIFGEDKIPQIQEMDQTEISYMGDAVRYVYANIEMLSRGRRHQALRARQLGDLIATGASYKEIGDVYDVRKDTMRANMEYALVKLQKLGKQPLDELFADLVSSMADRERPEIGRPLSPGERVTRVLGKFSLLSTAGPAGLDADIELAASARSELLAKVRPRPRSPKAKPTTSRTPKAPKASVPKTTTPKIAKPKRTSSRSTGESSVSREEEDIVRLYLQDIGKHPLLTKEQETELAQKIEWGIEAQQQLQELGEDASVHQRRALERVITEGAAANAKFVQSNLRLVVSIAKKYTASGMPVLDLIQEGNFGLMHAVEKFDYRKGFKFSTYATWWIRQSIQRGIANTGRTVRLPVHAGEAIVKVQKARQRLIDSGYERSGITEAILAEEVGMPIAKVREIIGLVALDNMASLDEPLNYGGEESSATVQDLVGDAKSNDGYEEVERDVLSGNLWEALGVLDEREREILAMHFGLRDGEAKTLEAIAAEFHLTRERIRQIEARAIAKLRHPAMHKKLGDIADFLGN